LSAFKESLTFLEEFRNFKRKTLDNLGKFQLTINQVYSKNISKREKFDESNEIKKN
jgi:hypothetical protein